MKEQQAKIEDALSSSARSYLRGVTLDGMQSSDGFSDLEKSVKSEVQTTLSALGFTLVELTVLDLKSKNGEWLLGARADMVRARDQVLLGREWLDVESENIDLQELTFELALKQKTIERDYELNEKRAQMDQVFESDTIDIDDRKRRQSILEDQSNMDIADAERESARGTKVEQAERARKRATQSDDNDDQLDSEQHRRKVEAGTVDHEIDMENKAAAHDADLTRRAHDLESGKKRQDADDVDYAERLDQDRDFEGNKRNQELADDAADKSVARELDAEERRSKMQSEKMAALAEAERKLSEEENIHNQAMADKSKDMTPEQMIAFRAAEIAKTEGSEAAFDALSKMSDGKSSEELQKVQSEMYQQMLEQQKESSDSNSSSQKEMMAMMQQMMKDQLAASQVNIDNMAKSQAESAGQVKDALEKAAGQAQSMSEKSMDSMSVVAGKASERPDVQSVVTNLGKATSPNVVKECNSCSAHLASPYAFCGECGIKQ
jgi:hypothetical protein